MAIFSLHQCNYPGCNNLTYQRFCRGHIKHQYPISARQRGYDTRWEKVREIYGRKYPLCEDCLAKGIVKQKDLVHHIIPIAEGGNIYDENNLKSLCFECHGKY